MDCLKKLMILSLLIAAAALSGCAQDKAKNDKDSDPASAASSSEEDEEVPAAPAPDEKRVIKSMKAYTDGVLSHTEENDENGRHITASEYSGGQLKCTEEFKYDGDELSECTERYEDGRVLTTCYEYDSDGNMITSSGEWDDGRKTTKVCMSYENGLKVSTYYYISGTYIYVDGNGSSLTAETTTSGDDELTLLYKLEYTYDDEDRVCGIKQTGGVNGSGEADNEKTIEYSKFAREGENTVQRTMTRENGKLTAIQHTVYNENMDAVCVKNYELSNFRRSPKDYLVAEGEKFALRSEYTYEYEYY